MASNKLACPQCGTQFYGNRDVCPFCHACIHQVGGHACVKCGVYIETADERRAREVAARKAERDETRMRAIVRRTLLRGTEALPAPATYARAGRA